MYLGPGKVDTMETTVVQVSQDASTSYPTATTMHLNPENRGLPLNNQLPSPSAPNSAEMPSSSAKPSAENSEKDIRIRSKSTPSRLRGDAKCYVPRRAISLGNIPPHSGGVATYPAYSAIPSMLMTQDMTTTNSIPYHPTDVPAGHLHSPVMHASAFMDINAPRSPRIKYSPTFPTLAENSTLHLKTCAYRRFLPSHDPSVRANTPKLVNPFINIIRGDNSVQVTLKYNTALIYSVMAEHRSGNCGTPSRRKEAVGPYRTAAIWEFIGHTFARCERHKKLRPRKRRAIRETLDKTIPPSRLCNQILSDDEEIKKVLSDEEVRAEWAKFVNGTDNRDRSSPEYISDVLTLSTRLLSQERDQFRRQQEERRGRLRTRANMLDRYSFEKMPPASSFVKPVLPFAMRTETVQEETGVMDEWDGATKGTSKPNS